MSLYNKTYDIGNQKKFFMSSSRRRKILLDSHVCTHPLSKKLRNGRTTKQMEFATHKISTLRKHSILMIFYVMSCHTYILSVFTANAIHISVCARPGVYIESRADRKLYFSIHLLYGFCPVLCTFFCHIHTTVSEKKGRTRYRKTFAHRDERERRPYEYENGYSNVGRCDMFRAAKGGRRR